MALTRVLTGVWPSLDVSALDSSLPTFTRQVEALVNRFSLASATLAARDYLARRAAAGIRGTFTVPVAQPPSVEQVDKSVSWATKGLWDARLRDPATPPAEVRTLEEAAHKALDGAAQRLVLDTGRQTTLDAVQADRQARAWAREARSNCCAFCAMLASRGAVYTSAHAAGENNSYHDNCHCQVVPVFGEYEMTAQARQWAADWKRVSAQVPPGSSLNDVRIAWRRFIEGREK